MKDQKKGKQQPDEDQQEKGKPTSGTCEKSGEKCQNPMANPDKGQHESTKVPEEEDAAEGA